MSFRKYQCPKCGQTAGLRIIYGYPEPELCRAAKRGAVILGGCCLTGNGPNFKCKACGHEWRFDPRRPAPKKEPEDTRRYY